MSQSTAISRAGFAWSATACASGCAASSRRSAPARSRGSSSPTMKQAGRSSRSSGRAAKRNQPRSKGSGRSCAHSRAWKASTGRSALASVDVGVALLGYGTVGASVSRMLAESGDEIERATGHRLRVVRALVRDAAKERSFPAGDGVVTTDFASIRDDPSINVVAEGMGGLEPAGGYVPELLRAGKPVVSANKQLIAREGAELFATASAAGVQLRFEASVCAAIPVVKVLRESLIATNVHRILGIVNGTTNFILSRMERGDSYADALAEAQALGYAEADPSDDVNGADAAAKMAILATVAFGSRVTLDDVDTRGITEVEPAHVSAAAQLGMVV